MSVWNRPLFQGSLPPGSARAELARMQMQEGGNALIEQLSGQDRGIVLPRDRAQAQRDRMQELEAERQQLSGYRDVSGEMRPNAPMVDSQSSMEIPRGAINEAGFWAPLFWLGTGAGAAITASPYLERLLGGEDQAPFQPTLPPLTDGTTGIVSPAAIQARNPEAPVIGTLGGGQDATPPTQDAVAAAAPAGSVEPQAAREPLAPAPLPQNEIGPLALASNFSFSPEERADRLRAAYEGREAVYDEILGDPERRRDNAKAQLFFSIAQRALQFASGVSPEGTPMSGSMLAQAAQSFAPVFGDVSQYLAAQDQQERELRAARLAAAEKDVTREEDSRERMLSALMAARGEGGMTAADVLPSAAQELQAIRDRFEQRGDSASVDLTPAYNFGSSLRSTAANLGSLVNLDIAPQTREAIRWGQQFNTTVLAELARSIQASRPSNFTLELVQNLLPAPGAPFQSVAAAVDAYKGLKSWLDEDVAGLAEEYTDYRALDMGTKAIDALSLLRRTKETSLQLEQIINGLEGNQPEQQIDALADVTTDPEPNATENGSP